MALSINDEGVLYGPYDTFKSAERKKKQLLKYYTYEFSKEYVDIVWIGGKKGWATVIYKPSGWSWSYFKRFVGVIP